MILLLALLSDERLHWDSHKAWQLSHGEPIERNTSHKSRRSLSDTSTYRSTTIHLVHTPTLHLHLTDTILPLD